MIPSILCYVPSSGEILGPMTPRFPTWTHDPPFSKQIDASDSKDCEQIPQAKIYTALLNTASFERSVRTTQDVCIASSLGQATQRCYQSQCDQIQPSATWNGLPVTFTL